MNISQEAGTAQTEGKMNDKLTQHVSDRIIGLIIMAENNMMSEPFAKRVADREEASFQIAKAAIEAAGVGELLEALTGLTDHYTQLVNCGDCGNWDPEKEPQVVAARTAIAKALGDE